MQVAEWLSQVVGGSEAKRSATVVSVCLSHGKTDGPDSHGLGQLSSHDSGGCTS